MSRRSVYEQSLNLTKTCDDFPSANADVMGLPHQAMVKRSINDMWNQSIFKVRSEDAYHTVHDRTGEGPEHVTYQYTATAGFSLPRVPFPVHRVQARREGA